MQPIDCDVIARALRSLWDPCKKRSTSRRKNGGSDARDALPPLKCLSQETRKTCGRSSRPGQDRDKRTRASRKRDRPEITAIPGGGRHTHQEGLISPQPEVIQLCHCQGPARFIAQKRCTVGQKLPVN